jgi:hypothetical protein
VIWWLNGCDSSTNQEDNSLHSSSNEVRPLPPPLRPPILRKNNRLEFKDPFPFSLITSILGKSSIPKRDRAWVLLTAPQEACLKSLHAADLDSRDISRAQFKAYLRSFLKSHLESCLRSHVGIHYLSRTPSRVYSRTLSRQ